MSKRTVQESDLDLLVLPDNRGRMLPGGAITGIQADMRWLGEPPTRAESEAYERKRAALLAEQGAA